MNTTFSAGYVARPLLHTVPRVSFLRRIGNVIDLVGLLRPNVQTPCPRSGSPVTPVWLSLWPSPVPSARGMGRTASMSPMPGRRQWVQGYSEGKIKGPARSSAQHLICRCWETARWPVLRVPCSKALAHRHELRQVLLAFVYAHLVGSVADDSV